MADTRKSFPLARLYERRLSGGRTHLVGKFGVGSQLIVAPAGVADDGSPFYNLFIAEADPQQPAQKRSNDYSRLSAASMFTKRP